MSDIQNDGTLLTWVIAAVGAIVTTLVSAVAYLFRKSEYDNAQAIKVLQEQNAKQELYAVDLNKHVERCEQDRTQLFSQTAVLTAKVSDFEKRLLKNEREER